MPIRLRLAALPWKKIAAWLGGLFILVGITGFLVLPPIVKSIALKELSTKLHREVTIDKIAINPYALTVTITGFDIKERDGGGSFVAFDELYLNTELSSLVRLAPVLKELRLTGPRLKLARTEVGRYNFSDLLDEFLAKPSDGPVPRFALNNIQITKGRIDLEDRPAGAKHEIADIALGIPFVSSIPSLTDLFVEPKFSARVNGAPLEISAKSKPFRQSLETAVSLDIDKFELARLNGYIPADIKLKIPSGRIDSKITVKFLRHPDKAATLEVSGEASLADLVVTEADGKPLVKLRQLDVTLADVSPLMRSARVSRLSVDGAELALRRAPSGQLNLLAALPANKPAARAAPDAPPFKLELDELVVSKAKLVVDNEAAVTDWRASIDSFDMVLKAYKSNNESPVKVDASISGMRIIKTVSKADVLQVPSLQIKDASIDLKNLEITLAELASSGAKLTLVRDADGKLDVEAMFAAKVAPGLTAVAEAVKEAAPDWTVNVKKFDIADYALTVTDKLAAGEATLAAEKMSLTGQDFSTRKDARGKFELKTTLNKTGVLGVAGTLVLQPLSGDMRIDARGIAILPFQPYFADRVNVDVTGGDVAFKGALDWKLAAAGAALPVSGEFSGVLDVTGFASTERVSAEDLLKWKSLHVGPVRGTLAPLAIQIEEIALTDFYSRLVLFPEGRLNVTGLLRRVDAATQAVAPPSDIAVDIGRVTLQGGTVNFFDRSMKPNQAFNLNDLGGTVTRLTATTPANVDLRGKLDNSAPLLIGGRVNPLSTDLFLDVKVSVKDYDLSPLTAYAGRYIGYGIEKGKLSLETSYKLENRKLDAQHQVYLNQLTLGDKVDSPEATKLPVSLALALLKDRNGNIDLDLPISGTLDDPQFSVASLVFKVIGNIIVKVLTAPFALLGSLFGGGGEELSWIEFAPGQAALNAAATAKLGNLAKALTDRPGLTLEIAGRVDPENDKEGLRRAKLDQAVKTQKFRALASRGNPAASVAEVSIEPAEYLQYLERAYDAASFPKPRNLVGLAKSLPQEEMEKLILTNISVTDDDLRLLADQRARAVQEAVLKAGIAPERVFLLATTIEAPAAKDKAKASRVDLSLK